jgi:dTDP-L-rhamnose 4-epimerase
MSKRILITGGAGFIGRHLAAALLRAGYRVRVLDCWNEQVHGSHPSVRLSSDVEQIKADVRDPDAVSRALHGIDAVVHLAAEVGVGQSMYAVERYVGVNDLGTAVLFEALIQKPVSRVIVASSMSIYGEGLYRDADGGVVETAERLPDMISARAWDPVDARGRPLEPIPTPEWKRPALASVYALTKFTQERLALVLAPAYGMEAVALRLWNTYGPGQALSNPYTGVLANFAIRLLNGTKPLIFEDGRQLRDFVHVDDVVLAFQLALEHPRAAGHVYNVGSGRVASVSEVAELLAREMHRPELVPEITGRMRAGDIRHCIPDITKISTELGFAPRRDLSDGLADLAEWVREQRAEDRVPQARAELEQRGLVL